MTEPQATYEAAADELAENGYISEAVNMLGVGYDHDQPAAVIDQPRTVYDIITLSRSCRTAPYNFELRLSCCAASHKTGVFYAEENMSEIDFEKYRKYFVIEGDCFYVRGDFINEIKELKGKLHLVYEYFLEGKTPSNVYSQKREDECAYNYIPASLKWDVFERDNFTCKICGSRRFLSVDHIFPKSKGGKTTIENCQTLCMTCNRKKGAR